MALGSALLTAAVVNAVPIPTHLVGAWLLEKIGRRITIGTYAGISIAGVVIFSLANSYGVALFGAALGLGFMAAAFSFTKLVAAEQYPTRLRGSGTTFTEAVGRGISGVLVPFVSGNLIINRGVPAASALAIGLGIVGLLLYVSFARETRGTILEDLDEASIIPAVAVAEVGLEG
jgi:putative MFS transporter